jgi:hypothetical protein
MNKIGLIVMLLFAAIVCVVTSYFMYSMFDDWGLPGWVGIALSLGIIGFVCTMLLKAFMRR